MKTSRISTQLIALMACLAISGCAKKDTVEITQSEHAKLKNLDKLTKNATQSVAEANSKLEESQVLKLQSDAQKEVNANDAAAIEKANDELKVRSEAVVASEQTAAQKSADALAKWNDVMAKQAVFEKAEADLKIAQAALENDRNNVESFATDLKARDADLVAAAIDLQKATLLLEAAKKIALSEISIAHADTFTIVNENKPYPFMIAVMGDTKVKAATTIRAALEALREKSGPNASLVQLSYRSNTRPWEISTSNPTSSVTLMDQYVVVLKGENVDKLLRTIQAQDKNLRIIVEPIKKIGIESFVKVVRKDPGVFSSAPEVIGPFPLNFSITDVDFGASAASKYNFNRHWEFAFGQASDSVVCRQVDAQSLQALLSAGQLNQIKFGKGSQAYSEKNPAEYLRQVFNESNQVAASGNLNASKTIDTIEITTYYWLPVDKGFRSPEPLSSEYTVNVAQGMSRVDVKAGDSHFILEDGNIRYYRLPITSTISMPSYSNALDKAIAVREMQKVLNQ